MGRVAKYPVVLAENQREELEAIGRTFKDLSPSSWHGYRKELRVHTPRNTIPVAHVGSENGRDHTAGERDPQELGLRKISENTIKEA